jgi:pimeloyl-ACP methyl ester carboxylesterase
MPHIDLPGRRIDYTDRGCGEPVLMLHCSGGSGGQWRGLAEALAPRMRALAPDLHGYGRSEGWPGDPGDFSLAHEAQAVHALLDRLAAPAHLVAHSYGGAVALHVARQRPHDVRSLVVIEPVALHLLRDGGPEDAANVREICTVAGAVDRSLAAGELETGYAGFVDYWGGPGAWAAVPVSRRDALAEQLPKIALDFQAIFGEPARLADFGTLRVPTLVLQGEHTVAPTRRICELLAATLPRARLHVVAGAGHMLPMTHRAEVEARIVAHIQAHAQHRVDDEALAAP